MIRRTPSRRGFTLTELILACGILAIVISGALIGMMRVADFINREGELLEADGYCWDVAWQLFNGDPDVLMQVAANRGVVKTGEKDEGETAEEVAEKFKVGDCVAWKYEVPPGALPDHFYLTGEPSPVCYVSVSNAQKVAFSGKHLLCIGVNLAWGARGQRCVLTTDRRFELVGDDRSAKYDFDHLILVGRYGDDRYGSSGEDEDE